MAAGRAEWRDTAVGRATIATAAAGLPAEQVAERTALSHAAAADVRVPGEDAAAERGILQPAMTLVLNRRGRRAAAKAAGMLISQRAAAAAAVEVAEAGPSLKAQPMQRQWTFKGSDGRRQGPICSAEVLSLHLRGVLGAELVLRPAELGPASSRPEEEYTISDWLMDLYLDLRPDP